MVIREQEFARIYDEFAPKIFAYCYFRVRSREEAEDLAAQTFFRVWDHVSAGKRVENAPAFLYRIAKNLVIDYYRKGRGEKELSIDDPHRPVDIPVQTDLAARLDQVRLEQSVFLALDQLPDTYREVVILRYVSELSIPEISGVLGVSENNVSVRLYRAIARLKSFFSVHD